MTLEVFNRKDEFVCALTNDNSLLGSFPIDDGMRIHARYLYNFWIDAFYLPNYFR